MCFSGMPIDSAAWWSSATARSARPTLVCEEQRQRRDQHRRRPPAAERSSWLMSMPVLSISQLIGSSWMPRSSAARRRPTASCADAFDDEGEADRRHEQRDLRLVHQRAQHEALGAEREHDHHAERRRAAPPRAAAPCSMQADERQRGEEHHRALREVEHARGLVDQHEAERDQRVHDAGQQAADQHLEEEPS